MRKTGWITTQVMLDAEKSEEAKIGFAAVDSLTFKDLSIEPCPTFPPQVSSQHVLIEHLVGRNQTFWERETWQMRLCDDQIITRDKMIILLLGATMWWSDYVQGQGALRNCDFEDDLCSWTIDSELNRFTNSSFFCSHGKLVNFVFIYSWERTLFVLVCSHWELFSTEAFVWNRATGSEQDGQSGPMIDHEGKDDSEYYFAYFYFCCCVSFYYCISLCPWLILMKNSKVIFLYCLIWATLVDNDGKSNTEYFLFYLFATMVDNAGTSDRMFFFSIFLQPWLIRMENPTMSTFCWYFAIWVDGW